VIAAGIPIEVVRQNEFIGVPRERLGNGSDFYALRVKGQSMIDENINDGDVVVIKNQQTARNGQKVVALLNGCEVTLKTYYREGNSIRLLPANPTFTPIIVDNLSDFRIQGIVVDIIKNEPMILDELPNIKVTSKKETHTKQNLVRLINTVVEGDCLTVMKQIPDKSVDMVLCDLPYGSTQNKWDSVIPLDQLWLHYERIIKDNGAIVLTSQGVFTAKLILSNPKLFKYKIVWVKSKPTNFLNAKKQPLRKHEDICIFYKNQPSYSPQMSKGEPYNKGFRKDQLTGSYGDFGSVEVKSEGQRYPTDVVYFKTSESEGEVFHPTQKPVELGRYLINTFTKQGDVVLDNTCGSGSFLVAAVLEERQFIGIEKNQETYLHKKHKVDYIQVCNERIEEAKKQLVTIKAQKTLF
jgi:site-specific DNA-methyltransferase (adenine-specific)